MKTYNIDVVKCKNYYYILDFTITRPVVGTARNEELAEVFATGYKAGIEIDSKLCFMPTIVKGESTEDIKKYIKEKKKYYDELWKVEK